MQIAVMHTYLKSHIGCGDTSSRPASAARRRSPPGDEHGQPAQRAPARWRRVHAHELEPGALEEVGPLAQRAVAPSAHDQQR